MHRSDVLVIGGGPAGLATAFWHLRRAPQARVRVLEAAPRPGGWIRSERRQGYLCERGPQGLRPDADFDELATALGLAPEIVPAAPTAKRRWIARDGHLLPTPLGPLSLLTSPLLSLRGKLRLLREGRVAHGSGAAESIAAFAARRFGPETAPLVRAMLRGIFAGSADRLEVQSALPMLAEAERDHGSVLAGMKARRRAARSSGTRPVRRPPLLSFRGGMQTLIDALARALGDSLQTSAAVAKLEQGLDGWTATLADGGVHQAPRLVLACPARESARLLADTSPALAAELAAIPYASVANVWLGLAADQRPQSQRGFGFLVEPAPTPSPLLGVLYCSDVFPDHAPAGHTLLRAMLGGVDSPGAVELDDARLIAIARAEVERHWGSRVEVAFTHVERVRNAIPQYEIGHGARMQRIDRCIRELPGLELRGNSYRGVAVTAQLGARHAPAATTSLAAAIGT